MSFQHFSGKTFNCTLWIHIISSLGIIRRSIKHIKLDRVLREPFTHAVVVTWRIHLANLQFQRNTIRYDFHLHQNAVDPQFVLSRPCSVHFFSIVSGIYVVNGIFSGIIAATFNTDCIQCQFSTVWSILVFCQYVANNRCNWVLALCIHHRKVRYKTRNIDAVPSIDLTKAPLVIQVLVSTIVDTKTWITNGAYNNPSGFLIGHFGGCSQKWSMCSIFFIFITKYPIAANGYSLA